MQEDCTGFAYMCALCKCQAAAAAVTPRSNLHFQTTTLHLRMKQKHSLYLLHRDASIIYANICWDAPFNFNDGRLFVQPEIIFVIFITLKEN